MMCMFDDCDPWDVYRSERRTARKQHRCGECGRVIEPGESYTWATGKQLGWGWSTFRVCAHCTVAATWLETVCGGWLYGAVGEDLQEHTTEPEPISSTALGELVALLDHHWRKGESLVPVETVQALVKTAQALVKTALDPWRDWDKADRAQRSASLLADHSS